MNLFWSLILGIVQGLTEFLPISSSAHLVIIQSLIPHFEQPGVLFDVVLHMGTLLAVVYFFRKTILKLTRKYVFFLFVGTVPAVVLGSAFQKQFEAMFGNVKMVGLELIITGILNLLVDKYNTKKFLSTYKESFIIGTAQAIAIIPGISRSGATIFSAVRLGIDKKKAAEFSFLLSLPAIIGANFLEIVSYGFDGNIRFSYYLAGFSAALVSGILAIGLVMKTLTSGNFKWFGFYSITVGILVYALF